MDKKKHYSKPIQFPCDFAIKIFGEANHDFEDKAINIVRRHCEEKHIKSVDKRHSRNGNYISLTITVYAENQAQLDSIYIELTNTPEVLMAL